MTKTAKQTSIRPDWLAQVNEPALEPELKAVDPHHHLWDHPASTYLAADFLLDAGPHGVGKSVFVECGSKYRATGPAALRPVGETEFVEAIAQKFEGGSLGCAVNAGIVGHADLMLGDAVEAVLEAHLAASPKRFSGYPPLCSLACQWTQFGNRTRAHRPHMLTLERFSRGLCPAGEVRTQLRCLALSQPNWGKLLALARGLPRNHNRVGSYGRDPSELDPMRVSETRSSRTGLNPWKPSLVTKM